MNFDRVSLVSLSLAFNKIKYGPCDGFLFRNERVRVSLGLILRTCTGWLALVWRQSTSVCVCVWAVKSVCRSNRDWVQAENWEQQTWLLFIEATIVIVLSYVRKQHFHHQCHRSFSNDLYFLLNLHPLSRPALIPPLTRSFSLNIFMGTIISKHAHNDSDSRKTEYWKRWSTQGWECIFVDVSLLRLF